MKSGLQSLSLALGVVFPFAGCAPSDRVLEKKSACEARDGVRHDDVVMIKGEEGKRILYVRNTDGIVTPTMPNCEFQYRFDVPEGQPIWTEQTASYKDYYCDCVITVHATSFDQLE